MLRLKLFFKNYKLFFIIIAIIAPFFATSGYVVHLMVLALLNAMLASSLNLTMGYSGRSNFGQAAFYGLGAYITAIFSTQLGFSFLSSLFLVLFLCAFFGFFVGSISLGLRGPYYCIVTIAFGEVLRILANNLVSVTHGPAGIPAIPVASIFDFKFTTRLQFYYIALIFLIISIWLISLLENSVIGRAWVAQRENELLAMALGVNVAKYSLIAYVIGAMIAGTAGWLYAYYIKYVSPEIFLFIVSRTIIVMLVIGGRGTLMGPVLGAIIFTFMSEYLRVLDELRLIILGLILLFTIIFIPQGLIYLPHKIKELKNEHAHG